KNFCRRFIFNADSDKPVKCAECSRHLKIFRKGMVHADTAIDHACIHIGKVMFTCRYCDYGTASRSAVKHHIPRVHKLDGWKENYNDLSTNYHEDIKTMLIRCFGQKIIEKSCDFKDTMSSM